MIVVGLAYLVGLPTRVAEMCMYRLVYPASHLARAVGWADQAIAAEFRSAGHKAIGVVADSTDADQIGAAVDTVVAEFGGLDILVNNAGIGFGSPILADNEDKHWDANWSVNVKGAVAFVLAQHLAKGLD